MDPRETGRSPAGCYGVYPARTAVTSRIRLSALSRWKLMDNLRRSLVPVGIDAAVLLDGSLAGRMVLDDGVLIGVLAIPAVTAVISDLLGQAAGSPLATASYHFRARRKAEFRPRYYSRLACLPYEAISASTQYGGPMCGFSSHTAGFWNGIPRTKSSASPDQQRLRPGSGIADAFRTMWIAPAIALTAVRGNSSSSTFHVDCCDCRCYCCGLVSPPIAWWISRPLPPRRAELTVAQINFLRQVARRTWLFFETFVGPEDNWLPPDNFQEHPVATVAHRTSPTNMGLSLLANVAAHDFGYIGARANCLSDSKYAAVDGNPGTIRRPFLQLVRHSNKAPLTR